MDLILEHRSLGKLKSTYVDALPLAVDPDDGRVHTSFNQTIAATGRLSSTNPNLQNIPIRTELGRRVRRAFVADTRPEYRLFENPVLVAADYSQIELRLLAHMSQEPFLVEAFARGDDIHAATAALIHDVPRDEVTPNMRRLAKTVNFGIIYGMQAQGLSRDTGLTRTAVSYTHLDRLSIFPNLGHVQRRYHQQMFRAEVQRFAAGHENPDAGTTGEDFCDDPSCRTYLLEVVEHQEGGSLTQCHLDLAETRCSWIFAQAQRLDD